MYILQIKFTVQTSWSLGQTMDFTPSAKSAPIPIAGRLSTTYQPVIVDTLLSFPHHGKADDT
jgi:hypothetical protein